MKRQRIEYVATIFCSRRDANGKTCWAIVIGRCEDDRVARGIINGNERTSTLAMQWLANAKNGTYWYVVQELAIREYRRLTADWPSLGCIGNEIVPAIEEQFADARRCWKSYIPANDRASQAGAL